jgi:hypothetical protein
MQALFKAYNAIYQPTSRWEDNKILDLTSAANANKNLNSSNKKQIKNITPIKIL